MLVKVYRIHPESKTPYILSQRRQARRLAQRMMPRLRSGRQWTKYRKFLKRTQGLDFLALPSYVTKE
jgi:hypothetical protein